MAETPRCPKCGAIVTFVGPRPDDTPETLVPCVCINHPVSCDWTGALPRPIASPKPIA